MMEHIEVGKPYAPALGLGEGCRFDIGGTGATLVYGFDNPTPEEISAMKSGQGFEIKFVTIGGIIWVLSKCGSLNWTDAPYNPRLSTAIPDPSSITDGGGLALTLMMLDSRDTVVKSGRLIGLGTEFSRRLLKEAHDVRQNPLTIMEANMSINRTMMAYPTSKLVKMARPQDGFRL